MVMVTTCPTPHLHPRYRRQRLLSFAALFLVLGTLYLGYVRFDNMATTAQKLLPISLDGASGSSGAGGDDTKAAANDDDALARTDDLPGQKPLAPMSYGTTARPPFRDLKPMATLAEKHIPTTSQSSHRLIIIGDVHGQLEPLKRLLEKVEYSKARGDHVIFTGDLVSKGPDSAGVVALAMEMGASGVRGNHEDRVLLAWQNTKQPHKVGSSGEGKGEEEEEDDMSEAFFSQGDDKDLRVARSLSEAQRKWISELPVILQLGKIPNHGNVAVVHAGLVPEVALDRQDSWAVMNMRTLIYPGEQARREQIKKDLEEAARKKQQQDGNNNKNKHVVIAQSWIDSEWEKAKQRGDTQHDRDVSLPTEGRDGRSWADAWNERQAALGDDQDAEGRLSIVYGHDAKTGLNVGKYTFGLDSGCVKGGQLSAMVFYPGTKGRVEHMILQVECEKAKGLGDE